MDRRSIRCGVALLLLTSLQVGCSSPHRPPVPLLELHETGPEAGAAPVTESGSRPGQGEKPAGAGTPNQVPVSAGPASHAPTGSPAASQKPGQSGAPGKTAATASAQTPRDGTRGSQPAQAAPAAAKPPKEEPPTKRPPRLAVLMYHDVDDQFTNAVTIPPQQLIDHIQMLKEEGYAFYRLEDVERLLSGAERMPEKGVLLTFDDGYSSFYTEVLPIAERMGVPATCFVITKYLDQVVTGARPHMANYQTREAALSPYTELGGHSYDAHFLGLTADGSAQPALVSRIIRPGKLQEETIEEYRERIRVDFARSIQLLREHGETTGLRHFAFPFTARSEEAVRLGQEAGVRYFYIGGEGLVRPDTDPTAIPRVHAGAPEITTEVLKERLRWLFSQP